LASSATYLYQDGPRLWYSTQHTVTKLAEDRSEQLKRNPDKVAMELDARVRNDLKKTGDFVRIHAMPKSGADVPDDLDARLVVLSSDHLYAKDGDSAAEIAARAILESRGNAPRLYRNTLVFLAADKVRMQDLDEALRKYLAWSSILDEKVSLNLDPHQVRQAETQKTAADGAVTARLPETYQWLLVPEQRSPQAAVQWQALPLRGNDALAVRASKKLRSDELMLTGLGPTILRKHMDDVPLWASNHVAVKQLVDFFARYLYLPRTTGPEVLVQAIREGLSLITWEADTFAYADSYDDGAGRYRGVRTGTLVSVSQDSSGLLVKSGVAQAQLDAEVPPTKRDDGDGQRPTKTPDDVQDPTGGKTGVSPPPPPPLRPTRKLKRFHGTSRLDTTRVGRDAGRIAEEVIVHLSGLEGAEVTVRIDIEALIPDGAPEHVVRTVTENIRSLKFDAGGGFEEE
jgi:hypothetical protein